MKKVISILAVSSLLFSTSFIYAENKEELNRKLSENKQEQEGLDKQINSLDAKIEKNELNIKEINNKISRLDSEIVETLLEIKKLETNITNNEELLGQRLKIINSNYSVGYLKVILSSSSLSDFFNNIYMVRQVVGQDKELLKTLDDNKVEIEAKEMELQDKKQQQEELKKSLEQDNENIQINKQELERLKNQLEKEESELESEIEKLTSQSTVGEGAIISSGSWPVPGHSVNSPYGPRMHPVLNVKKMHTGIDIAAPTGTPALAIDNGKVIFSGDKGGYGRTVMIQHDDGKVTLYAHNSQLIVSVGDRVKKGQVVTKIGTTGMSTGPHLHFEVRINGKHTNPMPYIQ